MNRRGWAVTQGLVWFQLGREGRIGTNSNIVKHNTSRRSLFGLSVLNLLLIGLLVSNSVGMVRAQNGDSSSVQPRVQMACSFLKALYNPSLRLVKEAPTRNIYYIASDNLLAQRALETCSPDTGQSIRASISSCCGQGYNLMHEAILAAEIPLPIHTVNVLVVANSTAGRLFRGASPSLAGGNYTVYWDVHNNTGTFPDCAYADVTAYTAIELAREGNLDGALQRVGCLNTMYDGKGLLDQPYKTGSRGVRGVYQTFKTALYMLALERLSQPIPAQLQQTILQMQGADGGFHTGYDQALTFSGTQENVETTSIVALTLTSLSISPSPGSPLPMGILLYPTIAVLLAGSAITFVAVWRPGRRKKNMDRSNSYIEK